MIIMAIIFIKICIEFPCTILITETYVKSHKKIFGQKYQLTKTPNFEKKQIVAHSKSRRNSTPGQIPLCPKITIGPVFHTNPSNPVRSFSNYPSKKSSWYPASIYSRPSEPRARQRAPRRRTASRPIGSADFKPTNDTKLADGRTDVRVRPIL